MGKKILLLLLVAIAVYSAIFYFWKKPAVPTVNPVATILSIPTPTIEPSPTPYPLITPPLMKVLPGGSHSFQTFNNCGPAALSMALSYYGISVSQGELGQALRPYQNPQGDNDDKSVTLEELAEKSKEYGLIPYHRPNGNIQLIKQLIAHDIPVITRTLLTLGEDIGHYRVIKGYDDTTQEIIQDDSLQGANLKYLLSDFDALWKQFNYEYLILVPAEKIEIIENILGDDLDEKVSWEKAVERSTSQLETDQNDLYARLNLSVAYYNTGMYKESVSEFEKIESRLPFRTLWYQTEPIEAYFRLGNYEKVFSLTDGILNNYNRAFSELYVLRGMIYEKQGNANLAQTEFDKARLYNNGLDIDNARTRFDK
jgi:tetratricopeptide (TPR) repeat protein